jgi:hypothetical protein
MSAAVVPALDATTLAELDRLAALTWRDYDAERAAGARGLGMPLRDVDRLVYQKRGAATAELRSRAP